MTARWKSVLSAIAVVVLLEASVAVVEAAEPAKAKFTIGFVSPGQDAPFWIGTAKGAQAADEALDDVTVVVGSGSVSGDFAQMVPVIQNMITQNVDAILVPGLPQVVPALNKAKAAKIPIIFYADGLAGSDLPVSTVNTNNEKGGEMAGKYIKEQMGGTGSLAILRYPPGQYESVDQRVTGVLAALKDTSIEVTYMDVGCDTIAPAIAGAQNVLTRIPDLKAFFGQCGLPVLGAEQAIEQAKIDPSKILTVGYDGTPAEIDAILQGKQDATIAQDPAKIGETAVRIAEQFLKGEAVPKAVDVDTVLITKENAAQFSTKQ